jgi:hypothetical protein
MTLKLEQLSTALAIPVDDLKERLAQVALRNIFDGESRIPSDWPAGLSASSPLPQLANTHYSADSPVLNPVPQYEPAVTDEPTQRLTIDIPASLHLAIKAGCYQRGRTIKEEVLAILQNHYCPAK